MPKREQNSNKGTFGKVLNVAGSDNFIGAAYLSSLSVLRTGAGYVALASCEKVINSVSQMLPEAVYITREDGLKNIDGYTVVLMGCGLGQSEQAKKDVISFLNKRKNIPTVIDADGLNIISKIPEIILDNNVVLTPHPAEAARLLGVNISEILDDIENAAKKISEKFNAVAVLKTHRTVVCDTDGKIYINNHGNSALAKAGTGDVLAGIIAGLLAQKLTAFEAAKLGVYLHSRAGEIASEELSEYSVLASDLCKYLPRAIKELI